MEEMISGSSVEWVDMWTFPFQHWLGPYTMISKRISTTPFFAAHQNWTPIQRPMRNEWQWSPLTRNEGSTSFALTWSLYGFQINSSVLLLLKEQEIGRFEQNSQQVWKSISPRFKFKQVHVDGVEEETFDHWVPCYWGVGWVVGGIAQNCGNSTFRNRCLGIIMVCSGKVV